MDIKRRKSREVAIGGVRIGSDNPIAVQSMVKVDTKDIEKVVSQIRRCQAAGATIMRLAVKDNNAVLAIGPIRKAVKIPLVADIHFDYKLALAAIKAGVDKIRINPGNIFKLDQIKEIVACAKDSGVAIRVGINSGSLRKKSKESQQNSLVRSCIEYIRTLEKLGFYNTVLSIKSSDVLETAAANRKIASLVDYPLHLGVTATGFAQVGFTKSAICLGMLLTEGIGDTIRVSLTDQPEQEVYAGRNILSALELGSNIDVIACPTCGRCQVDLFSILKDLESKFSSLKINKSLKVAVMGCVVNGPGEASCADVGIAFGKGSGLLFKKGRAVRKISQKNASKVLFKEVKKMVNREN